jgi:hypothetical protein
MTKVFRGHSRHLTPDRSDACPPSAFVPTLLVHHAARPLTAGSDIRKSRNQRMVLRAQMNDTVVKGILVNCIWRLNCPLAGGRCHICERPGMPKRVFGGKQAGHMKLSQAVFDVEYG